MVTEAELIERIAVDFPVSNREINNLIRNGPRGVQTPAMPMPIPIPGKVKSLKRWQCRGAVCDAHTQYEARRIFKQTWRDVELRDVIRISRHGHWV